MTIVAKPAGPLLALLLASAASLTRPLATPLAAQSISIGLRGSGSVPTGAFSDKTASNATTDDALINGAKNGFGYGLDVGVGLGLLGVYGGFDHIKFDCETATCRSDGKYTLQGVAVGVKLTPPMVAAFRPFVKAGVTFNDLKGGYGGSSSNRLTTDHTPGFELGVGGDITLVSLLSLTPQVRYVGQNFKARIPGVSTPTTDTEQGVHYFSFDLGLSVHTPFAMR